MSEGFMSRGFRGRRRQTEGDARLPPGQYLVGGFPILSAGPTPRPPLEEWDFSIVGEVDGARRWTWEEFRALPSEEITTDIHCVTRWSKLGTGWEGVSVDTLLGELETAASTSRPSATATTPRTCRWRRSRGQGLDRLLLRGGAP
jgi:DMSO/TMAO reductase YedYZ molybdopterin-dependent catalytic subunit